MGAHSDLRVPTWSLNMQDFYSPEEVTVLAARVSGGDGAYKKGPLTSTSTAKAESRVVPSQLAPRVRCEPVCLVFLHPTVFCTGRFPTLPPNDWQKPEGRCYTRVRGEHAASWNMH